MILHNAPGNAIPKIHYVLVSIASYDVELTLQFALRSNERDLFCTAWVDKEIVMENVHIRTQTTMIMGEAREETPVMTEGTLPLVQMIQCIATCVLVKRLEV
ncbi:hypothetical protein L1987_65909 [Smallanthus sonchifolius]|uniref:Uncharacterized protein n=1 Tax=Smallanthus sonchifolius TaxID=185202 RepID=A0ACB9BVV6_9ASTR|nr:hypothetical protein L1987_65909 [Smallanthus sonchifolius]